MAAPTAGDQGGAAWRPCVIPPPNNCIAAPVPRSGRPGARSKRPGPQRRLQRPPGAAAGRGPAPSWQQSWFGGGRESGGGALRKSGQLPAAGGPRTAGGAGRALYRKEAKITGGCRGSVMPSPAAAAAAPDRAQRQPAHAADQRPTSRSLCSCHSEPREGIHS